MDKLNQRIKAFLIENGCTPEKDNFYSWYKAPNGHRFRIEAIQDDTFILYHEDSKGIKHNFKDNTQIKNLEEIIKGFILWMLSEEG